jgi:hypothetical protein
LPLPRPFTLIDALARLYKHKIFSIIHSKRDHSITILKRFSFVITQENDDINRNTKEITLLARQAIELYRASQQVSIYAKPILLYYSYTKLARILFLSTYKSETATGKHGLSLGDNTSIICQKAGAFAHFHDSYSWNPSIYLNGCKFRWQDLIREKQKNKRYGLIMNIRNCNRIYLNEINSSNPRFKEHELTREIIFLYAMSMLARYRVDKWNTLIEGKGSDDIWNIQEYLTSTQSLFPNLIFNQLECNSYYFYPAPLEIMEIPNTSSQEFDWIL